MGCRGARVLGFIVEEGLPDLLSLEIGARDDRSGSPWGFWGRDYQQRLAANGTRLLTPQRRRTAANLGRERGLAATRLVIESASPT
jgi:hypothetical protein